MYVNKQIHWRRAWQHTLVFSPRESHGQRSLAGYSPWGHKELDATEELYIHMCMYAHVWVHVCVLWKEIKYTSSQLFYYNICFLHN